MKYLFIWDIKKYNKKVKELWLENQETHYTDLEELIILKKRYKNFNLDYKLIIY